MAYQGIGTGTTPNDGTGDDLLEGAVKINSNFSEIYSTFGTGILSGSVLKPVTTTNLSKTLLNNEFCQVNSSGLTLTLPASPYDSNEVTVSVGNFVNTVIARTAPTTIMGLSENLTIDYPNTSITLIYLSSTNDWRIK
jgi:hypothetical protein